MGVDYRNFYLRVRVILKKKCIRPQVGYTSISNCWTVLFSSNNLSLSSLFSYFNSVGSGSSSVSNFGSSLFSNSFNGSFSLSLSSFACVTTAANERHSRNSDNHQRENFFHGELI